LLAEIIKKDHFSAGVVDLSFLSSTGLDIYQISKIFPLMDPNENYHVDMSHFQNISVRDICELLNVVPRIKGLILMDTSIKTKDLRAFIQDRANTSIIRHLSFVTHPGLFQPLNAITFKDGFTFIQAKPEMFGGDASVSHTLFWTPANIIQCLIRYLKAKIMAYRLSYGFDSMAGMTALSGFELHDNEIRAGESTATWGKRSVPFIADFPGKDIDCNRWFFYLEVVYREAVAMGSEECFRYRFCRRQPECEQQDEPPIIPRIPR
jgi:hypothetical protein